MESEKKTEVADVRKNLSDAFVAQVGASGFLLNAWRATLSPERTAHLQEFLSKGLRLVVTTAQREGDPMVVVNLIDQAGGLQTLDTIEFVGGAMTVH